MHLTEATLEDASGSIRIVWFNQPYIAQSVEEGANMSCAGQISADRDGLLMKNPIHEIGNENVHTGRIIPIYPTTNGITQKQIRFLMQQSLPAISEYQDALPENILAENNFPDKQKALLAIHNPATIDAFKQAKQRLQFEELFVLQLASERARRTLKEQQSPSIDFNELSIKKFVDSLPFTLTDDQKRSAWSILKDIQKTHPMNRLLQGDVGSGKTVVAAIAAYNASQAGYQTVIMAPTEILAQQHYKTITALLPDMATGLLTSTTVQSSTHEQCTKKTLKESVSDGSVSLLIGTHAVIQSDITFKNLGLIVIDEQHRFGVEQRKALVRKSADSRVPHFLSMTATPIPRSLALTVYGDLDISTIRALPQDRKPIITRLLPDKKRNEAYERIDAQIETGRQVFVVCPLIEENDALGVKAATKEFESLKETVFAHRKIGLLHGKLTSDEKKSIMQQFKSRELDILVTTSVIEVGVDVPNATIMLIEGSERFGLSQLHQFRGRVGRGEHQSYCFLAFNGGKEVYDRLARFIQAKNGFEIAEIDLELRGPGSVYGTEQSGYADYLTIGNLFDFEMLSAAREQARILLENDSALTQYPALNHAVKSIEQTIHFE